MSFIEIFKKWSGVFCFIGLVILLQDTAVSAVDLKATADNFADTVQKIGLSVLSVTMIIGGTMMGFGNARGTMMVIFSIIGGIIVLVSSGIIAAIQQAIN